MSLTIIERIKRALRQGKQSEVGGVLVGEHVEGDTFRIVDLSVQLSGGTATDFVRDPILAKAFLEDFFSRTGNIYNRFNYIGEWHTHPSFTPLPSNEDVATMRDLVHDVEVGVNFAVLLIACWQPMSCLELSATLFRPGKKPENASVEIEDFRPHDTGA